MNELGRQFGWSSLGAFGVEVDCDLNDDLGEEGARQLLDLFRRHDLLVFRKQRVTLDRQIEIGQIFGEVSNCFENVGQLSTEVGPGEIGAMATIRFTFHSDYSFAPSPLAAISLHALDVVDGASATLFVSSANAYTDASPELKARLADMQLEMVATQAQDNARPARHLGPESFFLRETRKALWHDSLSGKMCILANEMHTSRVLDVPEAESETFLTGLFNDMYGPGKTYEHKWNRGDFVVWNNMTLQHGRGDLTKVGRRVLQRVCIGKGLSEQYPGLTDAYK